MEKQSRISELLGKIMQTQEGREFFFELLELSMMGYPLVVSNQGYMGYEIGRRSVGAEMLYKLRNDIDNGLELELLMRQEARARPQEKTKDPYDIFEGGIV